MVCVFQIYLNEYQIALTVFLQCPPMMIIQACLRLMAAEFFCWAEGKDTPVSIAKSLFITDVIGLLKLRSHGLSSSLLRVISLMPISYLS